MSLNDISTNDVEKTRASFGAPGSTVSAYDRQTLLQPRRSDAPMPPRRQAMKKMTASVLVGPHGENDLEEEPDDFGLIPSSLDMVEKTDDTRTRRGTFMRMPKGAFKESLKQMTKINAKDITSLVKARFMGQSDQGISPRKQSSAERKLSDANEIKRSIIDFVQKFGFVEMAEIDQLLAANRSSRSTIEIGLDKVERSITRQGQSQNGEELSPEDDYEHDPFTFMNDRLIDEKMYIEDILDIPLFDTEILNNLNAALDGQYTGVLCSYALSENNYWISLFGTENGEIIEVILGEKVSIKKHTLDNKITVLAISPNDEYLAAGSQGSELLFKKTKGQMAKKYIKNLNQQKITSIKFTDNNAALVGTMFNVYYFVISSYSLLLEVTMTSVMLRQPSMVMQVTSHYQGGILRIVVALNDKVSLYGLIREENKKEAQVYKVGADVEDELFNSASQNNKWPPAVDWILPESEEDPIRVVIFWKSKIWFIDFLSNNWVLKAPRDIGIKVVWGKVLQNRILCMVNTNLEIEFLSIDRVFSDINFNDEGGFAKLAIHPGILKDQRDTQYMMKYKDKLEDENIDLAMKLPFFQFFRNRMKDIGDTIYLITDKGIMRYRLVNFEKLIDTYIVKGQSLSALRLINNLYLGRIFGSDKDKMEVRELVPVAIKNYIEKNQSMYKDMLTEHQLDLIDVAMETLIYSGNIESIFEIVKPKFQQKMFWGQISKFVKESLLKTIPYEHLVSGYQYLDNEIIIQLLKDFTVADAEDEDDPAINKILMVIKKKNIWPYLYKFCIYYPNRSIPIFLTMLVAEIMMDPSIKDSILKDAIWENPQNIDLDTYFDDENRRLFFRIFWFFDLVLAPNSLENSLTHFSGQSELLAANIPDIYAKTLEWILDGNNAKIVIQTHSQMFFETIYQCVNNIKLLKSQKVIDLVKKIKNIHLKKTDQTNDLKFVASFRATQSLNYEPYPFVVAENILMIIDEILEDKYKQDLAFATIKVLNFGTHERKFENQEWICSTLMNVMREQFLANRFWIDYKSITQDRFEDLVIGACDRLDNNKFLLPHKKTIAQCALDNKYTRVYVHMIGSEIKLLDVFRLFLKNTNQNNCQYLFEWIKKNIADPAVDKFELTEELTKWMDRLVGKS